MTQMKYATVYANEFLQNEIKQMPTNETKWNEMQNTSQTIKTNFFSQIYKYCENIQRKLEMQI